MVPFLARTETETEFSILHTPAFTLEEEKEGVDPAVVDGTVASELKSLLASLLPHAVNPWADWPDLKYALLIHFVKAGFAIDASTGSLVEGEDVDAVADGDKRQQQQTQDSDKSKSASLCAGVQLLVDGHPSRQSGESIPLDHAKKPGELREEQQQRRQQEKRLFAVIPTSLESVSFVLLSSALSLVPREVSDAEAGEWLDAKRSADIWDEADVELLVEFDDMFGTHTGISSQVSAVQAAR